MIDKASFTTPIGLPKVWAFVVTMSVLASVTGYPLKEIWRMPAQVDDAIRATGLILFTFLALGLMLYTEFRYSRKARYAEALSNTHQVFHKLRDASFMLAEGNSADSAMNHVQEATVNIAAAFSLLTGVHCRACIKQVEFDSSADGASPNYERHLRVKTLCRNECEIHAVEAADFVSDNTDFKTLFVNPDQPMFFSNNLFDYPAYTNSHWDEQAHRSRNVDYVSTMVWPIRKKLPGNDQKQRLWGFLCVDSRSRNVFDRRYDFYIGAAFADALYAVLSMMPLR